MFEAQKIKVYIYVIGGLFRGSLIFTLDFWILNFYYTNCIIYIFVPNYIIYYLLYCA